MPSPTIWLRTTRLTGMVVALVATLAAAQPAAQERAMANGQGLVLERTGGFAGMRQRLEVDAGYKHLVASDRFTGKTERDLDAAEAKQLKALVEKAKAAGKPAARGEPAASDTFTVKLFVDGEAEPRLQITTLASPVSRGDGTAWGDLLSYADKLLSQELKKTKPKGAPEILTPEDLEK